MTKVLRAVFIVVVLAAIFVPAMIAMEYVAITQIYSYFTDHLANLLGVNMYVIRAGVVVAVAPFLYAIRLLFSLSSTKRKIGSAMLTAFIVVYNIGLYQATKDLYFTFQEGKILKWYALTPEGVKFFDRGGVDPVYGISLKPVTPDVVRNLKMIEKGDFRTADPAQIAWFNPITGDPQLWYYQSPDGDIEFYNKPGYHPFTNEALKPVTKDIYFRWREREKVKTAAMAPSPPTPSSPHATSATGSAVSGPLVGRHASSAVPTPPTKVDERQQRLSDFRSLINTGIRLVPGKKNIAILIAPSGGGGFSPDQAFYGHLRSEKAHFITDLFRHGLLTRGYFDDFYQGDKELLTIATTTSRVDHLILGRLNYTFKKGSPVDGDLVSCEVGFSCKVINHNGDVVKNDSFRVIGPGFSESAALERGIQMLTDQFSERILKFIL